MQITFNTEDLSATDKQILALLAGSAEAPAAPASKPASKPATAKPAAKAEPTPEAEPAEDTPASEGGATMEDAVALATSMVSTGKAAKVKEALAAVGAKRVSEIAEDQIQAFIDAANA